MRFFATLTFALLFASLYGSVHAADPWLSFWPGVVEGRGKHIVFVTGEEECRSEEAAPMLARVLSVRHGFRTTVLFPIHKNRAKDKKDEADGTIDPNTPDNIPGLESLDNADMAVLMLRFRELPDEDMRHIVEFVKAGKPLLVVRTSLFAFAYTTHRDSGYASWDWQSSGWPGGFGKQIAGETWTRSLGVRGRESTRGIVALDQVTHPVLHDVRDIWGPEEVYEIRDLPASARVLMHGQVLQEMNSQAPAIRGAKNDPLRPIAWLREYQHPEGKPGKAIVSTMGSARDLECAGLRRLFVNAIYWGCGVEPGLPGEANVDPVGEYKPSPSGFNGFKKKVTPESLQNPPPPKPAPVPPPAVAPPAAP